MPAEPRHAARMHSGTREYSEARSQDSTREHSETRPHESAWVHSSYSTMTNCVEAAPLVPGLHAVAVRDSKDRSGPQLRFGAGAWTAFLRAVGEG